MNLLAQTTLKAFTVSHRRALCFILLTDWEMNFMFALVEAYVLNTSICIKINISFPGLASRESANVIFYVYHAIKTAVCVFNQFHVSNLLACFMAFYYALMLCRASEGFVQIANLFDFERSIS